MQRAAAAVARARVVVARVQAGRDWAAEAARLAQLDKQLQGEALWAEQAEMKRLQKTRVALEGPVHTAQTMRARLTELEELVQMANEANDATVDDELCDMAEALHRDAERFAIELLMTEPGDAHDCYIDIKPGAGGVDSMDWAQMLSRMFLRWAPSSALGSFSAAVVDETAGDEAGLKSATLHVRGMHAFGWLKHEAGVHRLIRISPFDAQSRRHTSFAAVHVYAAESETGAASTAIPASDVRVDVYRASGAGGQHVNKTESAVRVTHLPTGTVAQSQSDRSQHRNRAIAMQLLAAKLLDAQRQQRLLEQVALKAARPPNAWGSQVRTYTLHPHQLVKDHRSHVESPDPQAVLDGDLDRRVEPTLTLACTDTGLNRFLLGGLQASASN